MPSYQNQQVKHTSPPTHPVFHVGQNLFDDWHVIKQFGTASRREGKVFLGVQNSKGLLGFCKACVSDAPNVTAALGDFALEWEIADKMSREAPDCCMTPLAKGQAVDRSGISHNCYIYELAEASANMRISALTQANAEWICQHFRQIAAALNTLHAKGIFHRDVQASNVLLFRQQSLTKLADFANAYVIGVKSPLSSQPYPAAFEVLPPESKLAIRWTSRDEQMRAADLYMFGATVFQAFVGEPLSPMLLKDLSRTEKGKLWEARAALPRLESQFDTALAKLLQKLKSALKGDASSLTGTMIDIVSRCCMPDATKRGFNPPGGKGELSQFSLLPVVQILANASSPER